MGKAGRKHFTKEDIEREMVVKQARYLIRRHGHMSYRSRHAFKVGVEFLGYLKKIYDLGGCEDIKSMMEDAGKDRSYFYSKLNWFYDNHCLE